MFSFAGGLGGGEEENREVWVICFVYCCCIYIMCMCNFFFTSLKSLNVYKPSNEIKTNPASVACEADLVQQKSTTVQWNSPECSCPPSFRHSFVEDQPVCVSGVGEGVGGGGSVCGCVCVEWE